MSKKTIIFNGFRFTVSHTGILTCLACTPGNWDKDVYIPSAFPTGEHITAIGEEAFLNSRGSYKKVTIDNNISTIAPGAFKKASIDTVVWPASCNIIPEFCFYEASIKSVINTENVTVVERGAFTSSSIKTFKWPSLCSVIPPTCFYDSSLESLTNCESVEEIEWAAFSGCKFKKFTVPKSVTKIGNSCFSGCSSLKKVILHDGITFIGGSAFATTEISEIAWPAECKVIRSLCFSGSSLKKISNLEQVEVIEDFAFADAVYLEEIDLSGNVACSIKKHAFSRCNCKKIIYPYYPAGIILDESFEE